MRAILLVAVLAAAGLAGCSGGTDSDPSLPTPDAPIAAGKGAISGLVIDDRYRPIPGAVVSLFPLGLQATSDSLGQFAFFDLEPGAYEAVVQAANHEAAPLPVDVVEGEYTEVELEARRVFSENGRIITTQYSVFIPCAADYVVNGIIVGCLADSSGDSWRPGFTTDVTKMGANLTYMVHEAKMNQVGDYDLQVRASDGSSSGGERYAVGFMRDTDYLKMTNQHGVKNEEHNEQDNNVPWNNTAPFDILVFMSGEQREALNELSGTTCNKDVDDLNRAVGSPARTCNWRGVGATFGIKATFIQSLFVGPPEVDLAGYHTLGPSV
ncbi:MAG: Carboxypeptidase regulatory-like domain [Thermoplasmata archaeon]|jgi:hypothetical protein|nr:Carboxypeptidase regulatory-like domain [Thermoplasmata archaeon]